ncbi:hypothetical protein [Streptomyces sp. NPDC059176]|uniref:hypothetical protein n=1 Tax=unclassified Streptomyces TaxID=2593676 RepID=UPI0036BDB5AD
MTTLSVRTEVEAGPSASNIAAAAVPVVIVNTINAEVREGLRCGFTRRVSARLLRQRGD